MHIIDINIMKLSYIHSTIEDFLNLLSLCKKKDAKVDYAIINENKFFFPEGNFSCDIKNFPLINKDPNAGCSPVVCCANGNNYVLLKTAGKDFVMEQITSLVAFLLNLDKAFSNVRILDAKFDENSSTYLILFNGNSCN